MGWVYESETRNETHEGYLVPAFEDGEHGIGTTGGDIAADAIAVEMLPDCTYRTRPAGEVIGWRVQCHCYQEGLSGHQTWASRQLWVRVPSKTLEDLAAHKLYAADEDIVDIDLRADVAEAARAQWRAEHIDAIDAGGAIQHALNSVHAAEANLDAAVQAARHRGLSWAKIGAAAGMSAQAAHERWAKTTDSKKS